MLEPLRRSRALVAGGGDAAAAADALLERAKRARPFKMFGAAVHLTKDIEENGCYAHAATSPAGGSFTARLKLGSSVECDFVIGLAAPGKVLAKNNNLFEDDDVWLLVDGGNLWGGGMHRDAEARPAANDVLHLEYDAGAATLRFLRGGLLLGQHTGVAHNPKIVVTMATAGNGAEFISAAAVAEEAASHRRRLAVLVAEGAAEAPVAALESSAAAAGRGRDEAAGHETQQQAGERAAGTGGVGTAAAEAAWLAAWQAAAVVLVPLRLSRALVAHSSSWGNSYEIVAGGGEASAAADALLERAARASPFAFREIGGGPDCIEVTKGGAAVHLTGDGNCGWSVGNCGHAATSPMCCSFVVRLKLGSSVYDCGIGLTAPGKDLAKNGYFFEDDDVWLLMSDGGLWADGKKRWAQASFEPGADVIDLEYDAGAATLRFLRGGLLLGQHTGVAHNPKIVVTMATGGNSAEFVGAEHPVKSKLGPQ